MKQQQIKYYIEVHFKNNTNWKKIDTKDWKKIFPDLCEEQYPNCTGRKMKQNA